MGKEKIMAIEITQEKEIAIVVDGQCPENCSRSCQFFHDFRVDTLKQNPIFKCFLYNVGLDMRRQFDPDEILRCQKCLEEFEAPAK